MTLFPIPLPKDCHTTRMAAIPFNCNLPEDLFTTNRAPTDEELAIARVLITNIENMLLDPTTETANVGSTDSQNHDLESLAALKTVVSPIRRVGEDIIRAVFLACLDESDTSTFPSVHSRDIPCTLTHISSGLRKIALSTQALWAAFHVKIDKRKSVLPTEGYNPAESTLRGHARLLDEWINHRSGNLPLRIAIQSERGIDNNNDLIDVLLSCHSRWRDIYFEWRPAFTDMVPSLQTLSVQDLPLLRSISLGFPLHNSTPLSSLPLFACTSLKKLYGISFEDLYTLKSLLPLSTITELQCETIHFRRPLLYADFSNILRQCVSLVHLDLAIDDREEREIIDSEIYLPRLRSLSIYEHVLNLRMLTAISAPQLEELDLNLNCIDYGSYTDHWPMDEIILFFKRSPKIQVLRVHDPMQANTMLTILQYCPLLTTLRTPRTTDRYSSWDSVLSRLIPIDTTLPVVCPKLQYLDVGHERGLIITNFSTIKMLIKCKLEPSPLLAPWKRLKIRFRYLEEEKEEADQLLALNDSYRIIIEGVRSES